MNKTKLTEAERIADELIKTHTALVNSGQPGLHPLATDTYKLAKAIRLFSAKAEPEIVSDLVRAQRRHEAAL